MSAKFFLDTNIFIYSFEGKSSNKARAALQLIRQAIEKRTGVVSYQVVQEFFHVALRRFSRPMTLSEAEQYLATTFRPLLVVNSSLSLYTEALQMVNRFKLPWYDALIVASAIASQCDVLYSEDLQHGQQFGKLRISNPFLP